jgi:hypothetical protein
MILEEELDFQGIEEEDEEEFPADSERPNNSGGDKDKGKACTSLTNRAVCIHESRVLLSSRLLLTCSVLFSSVDVLQDFTRPDDSSSGHFVSWAMARLVSRLYAKQTPCVNANRVDISSLGFSHSCTMPGIHVRHLFSDPKPSTDDVEAGLFLSLRPRERL